MPATLVAPVWAAAIWGPFVSCILGWLFCSLLLQLGLFFTTSCCINNEQLLTNRSHYRTLCLVVVLQLLLLASATLWAASVVVVEKLVDYLNFLIYTHAVPSSLSFLSSSSY